MDYYSDPEAYVADYAKKIRSHVAADPRASFTVDDFDLNTSKSPEGLQYSEEEVPAWGNWNMEGNGEGGAWQGFGGENGENGGGWQGFGGDASVDWANMDWENMDWENMDWGDMDFGDMDWGDGTFGGGQTSVVDFLIKRFEIIREALKK